MRGGPRVTLAILTAALWTGVGCGDPEPCGPARLTVGAATGPAPTGFVAYAASGDAVETLRCLGGADDSPGCVAGGATLAGYPATLVVKAAGFHTAELAPTCAGSGTALDASLVPLPAFEATADYATGFTASDGAAAFRALAAEVADGAGRNLVVKFLIVDVDRDPRVYFMNTVAHPLHYQFARQVLGLAVTQSEFTAQTYHGDDRRNVAGSIVLREGRAVASAALATDAVEPYTLEFFPSDDLSPAMARRAHRLLEERMLQAPLIGAAHRLMYSPATTLHEAALVADRGSFAARGVPWLTRAELYGDVAEQFLNPGKGCGTLQRLTPEQLVSTPLSYKDLVVLTRLPNEVPLIGGAITEELQTPLAHVNVAARARGTPNMALLGAGADPRVAPHLGALVCLEVGDDGFAITPVTLAEAQAFWDTLVPPTPVVPTSDLSVTGLQPFATLGFADAGAVGVKAANLAELSRLLPTYAPDGFAVPFAHYRAHVQRWVVTAGQCAAAHTACVATRAAEPCAHAAALCDAVAGRAGTIAALVDDVLVDPGVAQATATADAAVAAIRQVIETSTVEPALAAALDAEVRARFGTARVRLRSSSNAEDLPNFAGAGLYSSFAAQLGTATPPAVQLTKTWASVWNFAAFQERAFWNIDHRAVDMAVAVHVAFPDEDCNGVVITRSIANPAVEGHYVNVQRGEASVTNPENGALPEIYTAVPTGAGVLVLRDRYSSLSPGTPLMTEPEIAELYTAAATAHAHFAALYGVDPSGFALDLEFKRVPPGRRLVIKQARPYRQAR